MQLIDRDGSDAFTNNNRKLRELCDPNARLYAIVPSPQTQPSVASGMAALVPGSLSHPLRRSMEDQKVNLEGILLDVKQEQDQMIMKAIEATVKRLKKEWSEEKNRDDSQRADEKKERRNERKEDKKQAANKLKELENRHEELANEHKELKNEHKELKNKHDELTENVLEVNGWIACNVCDRSFSPLIKTDTWGNDRTRIWSIESNFAIFSTERKEFWP